jgi:putative heme-binding domain-containing protein
MDVDKVLQALIQTSYPQPIIALGSALRNSPEKLLSSWLVAIDNSSNTPRLPITFVAAASRSLTAACMRSQLPTASDSLQPNDKGPEWIEQARQIAIKGRHEVSQLAALACLNEWVRSQEESSALDDGFWSDLAELVSGSQNASQVTTSAIELLGYSPRQDDSRLLKSMIDRASQPTLTPTLLVAWSRSGAIETDQYLIDSLSSASPQILRSLLALIAQKPNRLALLAKQLDAGKITARQIGADELKKLVDRAKNDTQVTLKQHLEQIVNSNRAQVVSQYEPCLALTTDPNRGREVFSKHCASCHRIGDVGLQVGPDISDSRSKLPLQLLSSILDPNLAIDNNYFRFIALTEDDRVVEGMIAEETTETIVLLGQENKREVLRRDEILELKATGISLMPEGLEAQIDPQSMADLIAFIKGWRYLDSNIPAGDALKGN